MNIMSEAEENKHLDMASRMIDAIRHCAVLKMRAVEASPGKVKIQLPYQENLIGHPGTGSIHGGVLTTLMDSACGFAAILSLDEPQICPTLDLRIDYMSAANPNETMIGSAEVYRVTQKRHFCAWCSLPR